MIWVISFLVLFDIYPLDMLSLPSSNLHCGGESDATVDPRAC